MPNVYGPLSAATTLPTAYVREENETVHTVQRAGAFNDKTDQEGGVFTGFVRISRRNSAQRRLLK